MTAYDKMMGALRAKGCQEGKNSTWQCPAHEDLTPSLAIRNGSGKVLLHCFAGCATADVLAALGVTWNDLFDDGLPVTNTWDEVVDTYNYRDELGVLLYQVLRLSPKGFSQRRPDPATQWVYKLGDVRRVPYRLPELLAEIGTVDSVYVVEGEKDVDSLFAIGAVATCNPGGAGKWRDEYGQHLAGVNVVIVADRDDAGYRHAASVRRSIESVASAVKVVEAASGKDITDHLRAGHQLDELVPIDLDVRLAHLHHGQGPRPPDGYRLWTPSDGEVPVPTLDPAAYYGVVGDFLLKVAGKTEAHPAAIGVQVLACVGTLIGRRALYIVTPIRQFPKFYAGVVGPSSSGAKGVATDVSLMLVEAVDPKFLAQHSIAGLGSGQALIAEMSDDSGAEQRRIILEAELSHVLRVTRKEDSILGDILRKAFDNAPIRHSTKTTGITVSSEHHLSIVGSITPAELTALSSEVAVLNGFCNRFLYIWSQIRELLPFGADIDMVAISKLADRVNQALDRLARRYTVGGPCEMRFSEGAKPLWQAFYNARRTGIGSQETMRSLTARQVPHAIRLALIYAILDESDVINRDHLAAAIAWCDYSLATVQRVFGQTSSGNAGKLLEAIRAAGSEGLDGRGQDRVFAGHLAGGELERLRGELEEEMLIMSETSSTGGRPKMVSYAIWAK